ncbi:MAG: LytR C-terminal domain-containing protein [Candidatus Roizmanbacteria bacterium]
MLYLFIDDHTIKFLALKKTLLGQEEASFFEKTYEAQLLDKGRPINVDLLASAIKEVVTSPSKATSDNQTFLILPQEAFYYFRTEVPSDIAPTALDSFITDKARTKLPILPDDLIGDSFIKESDGQKVVAYFGLDKESYENYRQTLSLIDLKIVSILPDSLAYFKLFEKTLRPEKKEMILYTILDKDSINGYLFDNFGLLEEKKLSVKLDEENKAETVLKEKAEALKNDKKKLNRIIISGPGSDKIRQDTFTKSVGVWTNPLKRIVPTFYESYLKMLVVDNNKPFPLLNLDVCFGAFIFNQEEKFSLMKNGYKVKGKKSFSLPTLSLPKREIFLFIGSFALSFGLFLLISNFKSIKLPSFKKNSIVAPSPTSAPSPTPTPSFKKEELKIKVLNGSGTAGKASEMKDVLKDKGYQEIITDNADNYDYVKTELQVKKSKIQAFGMIKTDLKDYLTSFKETSLDEKETPDVVIIIGTDFK